MVENKQKTIIEYTNNTKLEKEILHSLSVRYIEDRDIKSLVINCNPNFSRGPDYQIEKKIVKILNKLIDKKIIKKEMNPKGRDVFSINQYEKVRLK